ncbi:MAG: D-alanyl-D-alanine carboxypeptidase/D-alanyl-D-alanine-endopeptidase [Acidobacteria bacterium]|nr:D-alanyl-D-alanine carboxypeptidase/D-alanyl-D-alanine-endopeptidase [Acidobacteriota bacterium]
MPKLHRILWSLLLLAGLTGVSLAEPAPPRTAPTLEASLAREVESARRTARAVGVHVVDLADDRVVYGYQEDQPRILASNTKLMTTAAALVDLGPGFRYQTRVALRGEVRGGTLEGDLAVFGAGDPNISGRFHDGDPYAIFRGWADELVARGISRVTGDLYLVNGIFEAPRVHPDWPRDQLSTWYEAPVDALSFSDNCVLVRVRPSRRSGAPPIVETVPPLDYFQVRNQAKTGEGRRGTLYVRREDDSDTLVVSGTIGRSSGHLDVWVAVHDPEAYFAASLRAALAERGISIAGGDRPVHGTPPGAWEQVAVFESTIEQTLEVTNKRSQNFYAESLAKLLGFRRAGEGSWHEATEAIGSFLVELGVPAGEFRLSDGSGLSRSNQATPRAMTRLLSRMYFHDFGREFVRSLPHSGEDGLRWERRLAAPPYRENVFAKTGTIRGVSTLSGYAKGASGRVYAFSILCNQVRSTSDAMAAQDRIVRALIDRG